MERRARTGIGHFGGFPGISGIGDVTYSARHSLLKAQNVAGREIRRIVKQ
jgi:hypothetical protein